MYLRQRLDVLLSGNRTTWSFRQRLHLRASTMLLLFIGLLVLVSLSEPLFAVFSRMVPGWEELFHRFTANAGRYAAIAGGFAAFFLGRSIVGKQPQFQFIIELVLAVIVYIYT